MSSLRFSGASSLLVIPRHPDAWNQAPPQDKPTPALSGSLHRRKPELPTFRRHAGTGGSYHGGLWIVGSLERKHN